MRRGVNGHALVMPGLVPGIHLLFWCQDVDCGDQPGHDGYFLGICLAFASAARFSACFLGALPSTASGPPPPPNRWRLAAPSYPHPAQITTPSLTPIPPSLAPSTH